MEFYSLIAVFVCLLSVWAMLHTFGHVCQVAYSHNSYESIVEQAGEMSIMQYQRPDPQKHQRGCGGGEEHSHYLTHTSVNNYSAHACVIVCDSENKNMPINSGQPN